MNGAARSRAMTSKNAELRQSDDEINPKIDPAPNSNTEKDPDDWVSEGDPSEPDNFKPELTKAEASKRIDALKSKRSSARQR
jgi:hypothetical protein